MRWPFALRSTVEAERAKTREAEFWKTHWQYSYHHVSAVTENLRHSTGLDLLRRQNAELREVNADLIKCLDGATFLVMRQPKIICGCARQGNT